MDILLGIRDFFNNWQNTITASGVFVAIFIAYWTVLNDRKNLKLTGLNLAFQKLNNREERQSRGKVMSAYHDYLIDNNLSIEYTSENFLETHPKVDLVELYPDLKEDVERVKSDFDEIVILIYFLF